MTENMKKFLEAVSAKEELVEKLNNATEEEVLALAKELGVELTKEELLEQKEVSDDELEAVSGGATRECVCIAGGGGKKGGNDKVCACVAGGVGYGYVSEYVVENDRWVIKKKKIKRCICVAAGYGDDEDGCFDSKYV